MKQKNDISTINLTTKNGNTLSLFFNAHTNTLVVDLVSANELGGSEIVRMVLDEDKLLSHLTPAYQRGCSRTNLKTPAEWCAKFGVEVLDPDGWNRKDPNCMKYPITQSEFIEKYQHSTARVVDYEKYLTYRHLFN